MARRTFSQLVHDYRWFHRWMGLVGNLSFVVGSVFFLFSSLYEAGTWVFIIASAGLFIDSVGEKLVNYEKERLEVTPS